MPKHSPHAKMVGIRHKGHSNVLLELIQDAYLGQGDFVGEDKILLSYLRLRSTYSGMGGNMPADLSELADVIGRGPRTARNHLRVLLEKGYVRIKEDGGYQFCSMYSLRPRANYKTRIVRINKKFLMTCTLKEFRAMLMEPVIEECFEVELKIKKRKFRSQFDKDEKGRFFDRRGELVPNKFVNPKVSTLRQRNLACVYAAMLCKKSASTMSNHRRMKITNNYKVPPVVRLSLPKDADIWQTVFDLNSDCLQGMYYSDGKSVFYSGITVREKCFSSVLSKCGSRFYAYSFSTGQAQSLR